MLASETLRATEARPGGQVVAGEVPSVLKIEEVQKCDGKEEEEEEDWSFLDKDDVAEHEVQEEETAYSGVDQVEEIEIIREGDVEDDEIHEEVTEEAEEVPREEGKPPERRVTKIRRVRTVVRKKQEPPPVVKPEPPPVDIKKDASVAAVRMITKAAKDQDTGAALSSRLGSSRRLAQDALCSHDDQIECPTCGDQVCRDHTFITFSGCEHRVHLSCYETAKRNHAIDGCLVCVSKQRSRGTETVLFDAVERSIDHIDVPDPNNTQYHPLSHHKLAPFAAYYQMSVEYAHESADTLPVLMDDKMKATAHRYGAEDVCDAPSNPRVLDEAPRRGLAGVLKNVATAASSLYGSNIAGEQAFRNPSAWYANLKALMQQKHDMATIAEKGFSIDDLIHSGITMDRLLELQYTLEDLETLKANNTHLLALGLQLHHLKHPHIMPKLHEISVMFKWDRDFVVEKLAGGDWRNLATSTIPARVLAHFGINWQFLKTHGAHPHWWNMFQYIPAKDFRDYMGLTQSVFENEPAVATEIFRRMEWQDHVLMDVFQVAVAKPDVPPTQQQQQPQQYPPQQPYIQSDPRSAYNHSSPPHPTQQQNYNSMPEQHHQQYRAPPGYENTRSQPQYPAWSPSGHLMHGGNFPQHATGYTDGFTQSASTYHGNPHYSVPERITNDNPGMPYGQHNLTPRTLVSPF